jgi:hypothetical protein
LRQGYSRELVRRDLERIGLGSPESLLARQLASQRTAFAIAGDGPVQSDVFPVLEYAAPEAFFIGAAASRIERFDERTWQSPLASPEKRMTLMNLDDDMLRSAFKNPSINTELRPLIASRLERAPGDPPAIQSDPATAVPCVFQMATNAAKERFPPKTSEDLKQLYRARASLQRDGADWAEQVQIMRRILTAQLTPGNTNSIGKIGAHFGGVAARACMAHSDLGLSEQMLNLGMKFLPDEPELSYLSRVLQRRRTEPGLSMRHASSGIAPAGTAAPGPDSSLQSVRELSASNPQDAPGNR